MKQFLKGICVIMTLCIAFSAQAQRFEPGLSLGGANYTGDVSYFNFIHVRPAADVFLRINLRPHHSLRAGLLGARLYAADKNSNDPFQNLRDVEFNTDFIEFSLRYEYNFRNFRDKYELVNTSPYVFLGGAASKMHVNGNFRDNTVPGIQFVVPFGIGLKHAMAYNWNLGLEFGARKTFTDHIDSIVNEPGLGKFQMSNPNNNDMYYFFGISISYAFEGVICPIVFK